MIEAGRRLGLAAEAGQIGGRGEFAPQEHLHRDDPPETLLPRPVDDPHPAAADLLEELVVAKQGRQCHRPRRHAVVGRCWSRGCARSARAGGAGAAIDRRGEDRRLPSHRVGDHHRREQLAKLRGEIGVGAEEGVEAAGIVAVVGQLVEKLGKAGLLGGRKGLIDGATPPLKAILANRPSRRAPFPACRHRRLPLLVIPS